MKASFWLHCGTNPLLPTWSTEFFRSPDRIINIRQQHKGELGVCGSEGYLFIIFLSSESFQLLFPGSRLGDRSFRRGGSAPSPEHGAGGTGHNPGALPGRVCLCLSICVSVCLSVCVCVCLTALPSLHSWGREPGPKPLAERRRVAG